MHVYMHMHAPTHTQSCKRTQGLAAQLEKLSLKPAPFISQPRFWEDEGISVCFYVSKITIANSQAQKIYRYLCRAPISERERAHTHTHTHIHTHTHTHTHTLMEMVKAWGLDIRSMCLFCGFSIPLMFSICLSNFSLCLYPSLWCFLFASLISLYLSMSPCPPSGGGDVPGNCAPLLNRNNGFLATGRT